MPTNRARANALKTIIGLDLLGQGSSLLPKLHKLFTRREVYSLKKKLGRKKIEELLWPKGSSDFKKTQKRAEDLLAKFNTLPDKELAEYAKLDRALRLHKSRVQAAVEALKRLVLAEEIPFLSYYEVSDDQYYLIPLYVPGINMFIGQARERCGKWQGREQLGMAFKARIEGKKKQRGTK